MIDKAKKLTFKMELFFIIAFAATATAASVNIQDFGAKPDGKTLSTAAIQKTIDSCEKAGGGIVMVPAGKYLTGTIRLRSNIELRLHPNAVLLGSRNLDDYNPLYLLYARDAENVAITGKGIINGQGDSFWRGKQRPYQRPERTILLKNCRDVTIRDIRIENSAMFNIALEECDRVNIDGIRIINDLKAPNTDGIDPTSSSNVFISNCYIETGDDAICLKSHSAKKSTENILVTNCVLISDDSAIKCGTSSHGIIQNCTFSNIIIRNTKYGIGFYMKDGGVYRNLQFSNMRIETVTAENAPAERATNSYPIFMDIESRTENGPLGKIENIQFSDLQIETFDGNCLIAGMPGMPIRELTLRNIRFRILAHRDFGKRHKPRGNRNIKYLAANDFASIPASFTFGYVDGLVLENVTVVDESKAGQPQRFDIWGRNLQYVHVQNLSVISDNRSRINPTLRLENAKNVRVENCKPGKSAAPFLKLSGAQTTGIKLIGNDLSTRKFPVIFSDELTQKVVVEKNNY